MSEAAAIPSSEANCSSPSGVWNAQPSGSADPHQRTGHALGDRPEVGRERQRARVLVRHTSRGTQGIEHGRGDVRIGLDAGHDRALAPRRPATRPGAARRARRGRPQSGDQMRNCAGRHEPATVLDITVEGQVFQHHRRPRVGRRPRCTAATTAASDRLWRAIVQQPCARDAGGIPTHPCRLASTRYRPARGGRRALHRCRPRHPPRRSTSCRCHARRCPVRGSRRQGSP